MQLGQGSDDDDDDDEVMKSHDFINEKPWLYYKLQPLK